MLHVQACHHNNGKQNIHERAGDGDNESLPARMRHELTGVTGGSFKRVLARHLYVSAERKNAQAVIGFIAFESKQALAEADRKNFHADAAKLGRSIVAKFMDENEQTEHQTNGQGVY